ncbi:MAG: FAD binding domain-containing protein [Nitriliruptoraceae bacterium]|nr:FAD binding domain-containing protein [Nitriliruptoraceae bacterium]
MKPPPFAYHAPRTVDGVLAALAELGDEGKVLAGGQSLVPMLNMRLAQPEALVDLSRVDGLDAIEVTDTHVRVEARVTHERLRRDPRVTPAVPLLRQALDWVAHPVIRNRGTSVGSIVHADPAAELPAVLGLLGGHMELRRVDGSREVAGRDYLLSPLDSDTAPEELAVAAVFPRPSAHTGSSFLELARRHGDYALAGVGAVVRLDEDRRLVSAEVACIGVGGVPVYVGLTEALRGQPHDALDLADAVGLVRAAIDPSDDIHATGAYRTHLTGVLAERALTQATAHATHEEIAA